MICSSHLCSSATQRVLGVSYQEMDEAQKMIFAIGIICVIGAIVCLAVAAGLKGNYPTLATIISVGGGVLTVPAVVSYFLLRARARSNNPRVLGTRIHFNQSIGYSLSGGLINVNVVKREIKAQPLVHLRELNPEILVQVNLYPAAPALDVTFLEQSGSDSGGLSKDYLDDLFQGLVQSEQLRFDTIESSSLVVPKAEPEDGEMLDAYLQMGRVMMWCYPTLLIGSHFDPSVFSVAFDLTVEELYGPFEELEFERKLELYRVLLAAQNDATHDELLALLENTEWDADEIQAAATRAYYSNCLPADLVESEAPNMAKILGSSENQLRVREGLKEITRAFLDPQLRGIHMLACGMHTIFEKREDQEEWGSYEALEFSARLQGSVDKELIAASIVYDGGNEEIQKKVGWLQEWIREEATDIEVKQLLKFITGSTGLELDEEISIAEQYVDDDIPVRPFPKVHSCNNQLELAPIPSAYESMNDFSKENFIECVKLVALGEGAGYTES